MRELISRTGPKKLYGSEDIRVESESQYSRVNLDMINMGRRESTTQGTFPVTSSTVLTRLGPVRVSDDYWRYTGDVGHRKCTTGFRGGVKIPYVDKLPLSVQ